ncbi:MAG: CoA ester lyase [Pseudomonadota bacterium]
MSQKTPRNFFKPLAIGAPQPLLELPVRLERMIHFVPPHNEKVRNKVPDMANQADVILANLEDAIPADAKDAARAGAVEMASMYDWQAEGTGFWSRVNCLNSPWFTEDVTELVLKAGHQLDVIMLPKVEGPWDIHFADQFVAQLEAKAGLSRPILFHAILETAEGVARVEEIALASPRMQGISLGPADLAASRKMKTTRVGGGHPFYRVIEDPHEDETAPRIAAQQDPWHYTIAKMVDACRMAGINAFYGPFGDIKDLAACEQQFRNAFLLGCAGTWSLHPNQIAIAKTVFSPDPDEVKFARRILEAMPDGTGVAMLDGKMQDDATWKQAKVIADLADLVAAKDPDLAAAYSA